MRGLALEGGGAKGAYHLGALKALYEAGYAFDGVVGTSIGALNGAIIVQDGGSIENLQKLWDNVKVSQLLDFDDEEWEMIQRGAINLGRIGYLIGKIKKFGRVRLESTDRMRKFISSYISEEKLRASKLDFGFAVFNMSDMKVIEVMKEDVAEGELLNYIIASANYPVYSTIEIDGNRLMDGGVANNLPVNLLIDRGYDEIICIRTRDRYQSVYESLYKGKNIKYIVPSEKMSMAMNFSRDRIDYYQKMGYYDANRMIKGYFGKHYYLQEVPDDDVKTTMLCLPDEAFYEALRAAGVAPVEDKIENYELFVSAVKRHQSEKKKDSDSMAIGLFLEDFATTYGIDRFEVFDPLELALKIYEKAKMDMFDPEGLLAKSKYCKTKVRKDMFVAIMKHFRVFKRD